MARHSTALGERRHRCCLPALAGFTRLPMHGTWPRRTVRRNTCPATKISEGLGSPEKIATQLNYQTAFRAVFLLNVPYPLRLRSEEVADRPEADGRPARREPEVR